MSSTERRTLAQAVEIILQPGGARESRLVEIRDHGVGIAPDKMDTTILSLNESNKIQKHYLAGMYGQGGSSTFVASKYSFIVSRRQASSRIGFTLVKFRDLPAELFKTGHYVYLTIDGRIPELIAEGEAFSPGTRVKHFGYDLSDYSSPLGPNSVYGLLNQILFDPVMPVWLDNRIHKYRRVIKGSRNALNGAVDDGDEVRKGPSLAHSIPMFYVDLGEWGRIGIEYWLLQKPDKENKIPNAAFVDSAKPIVLTLNGQNHAEMSGNLIKRSAELPYLKSRLICHIDCNSLSSSAKRLLFSSTREVARKGMVHNLIQDELIRALKSDDELVRLNLEARDSSIEERDQNAVEQMRREVSRILHIQGISISDSLGGVIGVGGVTPDRPTHPHRPRPAPLPLEVHEPPTYIRVLWDEDEPITFYSEQRRYIRIETDANGIYHDANDSRRSRLNVIISNGAVSYSGSSPLRGGRMRIILSGGTGAQIGTSGVIRVELIRVGLTTLSDERRFEIIERPPVRPSNRGVSLPDFVLIPVHGPETEKWMELEWPDNLEAVASSAAMSNGKLNIHYSTVFPQYAKQRAELERRDTSMADSFTKRYEIWLAVHSLLMYQDQLSTPPIDSTKAGEENSELAEQKERQERCRIASMAVLIARKEAQESTESD